MDRRAYLEGKFGGKEAAVRAYAPVVEHAEKAGLKINFEAMQRTPNTLNAHRLIHWAGIEGRQTAAVSALFKAYFVDARDIGDAEVLCDIADVIEMDASLVSRLLATDADVQDIRDRDAHSRKMGISGQRPQKMSRQNDTHECTHPRRSRNDAVRGDRATVSQRADVRRV